MEQNAANALLGKTLTTGWKVIEKFEKGDNDTGSFFSVCYKVEKDDEICFMKAYDFTKFFQIRDPNSSFVDVVSDMITAYKYERDLSVHCKSNHVTKVSFVKDSGEELVLNYSVSVVPYLIFDMADGDVRKKLHFTKNLDYAWRLKSLHDIAVGLMQLHKIEVSHQDLKPSNILVFNTDSKLGDLGRSMCQAVDGPYNNMPYTGDFTYAPPEIMYQYYEKDWLKRVFATDCYLLGSMIVFYFSGISMSVLLKNNLSQKFWYENWRGTYDELKDYLIDAFSKALIEFEENVKENILKDELRILVEYLCHPLPERRGHPKNRLSKFSSYNLERFVTLLDIARRKAELIVKSETY
jgi:serine/threonine protein kinase